MTDIAHLKSRIAEFVGHDPTPTSQQTGWASQFLAAFSGHVFDALHLRDGQVEAKFGQAQNMMPQTAELFGPDCAEANAIVCFADHDPDMLLFCAAQATEAIVLRSRTIPLDQVMARWRAVISADAKTARSPM